MWSILGILLLGNSFLGWTLWNDGERIAFVRSQELVNRYLGMKEARNKFQMKKKVWEGRLDSMKRDYMKDLEEFKEGKSDLSKNNADEQEAYFSRRKKKIRDYEMNMNKKVEERENELLQGVLDQVNSFVKEYAERKDYDIVMGTTLSGSVLYGKDRLDITEELLQELNKEYAGEDP